MTVDPVTEESNVPHDLVSTNNAVIEARQAREHLVERVITWLGTDDVIHVIVDPVGACGKYELYAVKPYWPLPAVNGKQHERPQQSNASRWTRSRRLMVRKNALTCESERRTLCPHRLAAMLTSLGQGARTFVLPAYLGRYLIAQGFLCFMT